MRRQALAHAVQGVAGDRVGKALPCPPYALRPRTSQKEAPIPHRNGEGGPGAAGVGWGAPLGGAHAINTPRRED